MDKRNCKWIREQKTCGRQNTGNKNGMKQNNRWTMSDRIEKGHKKT